MKIFITGGTGVLGRRLIPLLQEAGHEVSAPRHADLDLEDSAALREALQGVDVAYHLATRIATGARAGDATLWAENDRLRGVVTDLIVDAAIDRGIKSLIYPSISFLYPASGSANEETAWGSNNPTLRSSEIAERAVQRFDGDGRRGVIVRFGLFWGPDTASAEPDERFGATIHVDDAATALVAAHSLPGGIYNATSDGQRVSNEKLKAASDWRPRH
jgi:nucleoside-diphosphate-sugar epimerase